MYLKLSFQGLGLTMKIQIGHGKFKIQSQFFEANLALNLFISAQTSRSHSFSKDTWDADSKRRREISEMLEQEYIKQGKNYWESHEEIRLQTDIILK